MSLQLFSTFPQFVDDELDRRRDNRMEFQEPKSPWMRMISNFEPEGGERRVLIGGDLSLNQRLQFGFENLYEPTSTSGERYRPKPTINSVTVDEKLESFECTVEWTVYSIEQLERLFPYFMNLGTTVIVDFGWDDVPADAIIDPTDDGQLANQFRSLNSSMSKKVDSANSAISPSTKSRFNHPKYGVLEDGEGRYSFVAGSVVDFSYSPNGNNEYSCTTEITSVSKAMEKLRTRKQERQRSLPGQGQQQEKRRPYLYEWLQGSFMKHLGERKQDSDRNVVFIDGGEKDLNRREDGFSDHTYYVSWGEIEEIVNTYAALVRNEASTGGEAVALGDIRTFKLDSSDSIVSSYFPAVTNNDRPIQLRTMDPYACIVDVGGQSDKFRDLSQEYDVISESLNDDFSIRPKQQGFLYNLYVEYQLVLDAFETNETIFSALKYILRRCSSACFDIWNFDFEIDGNTIRVIDKNMVAENTVDTVLSEQGGEFEFQPNTRRTVLRDFNFDTNMSDIVKSQVVAQNNANLSGTSENAAQNARNDSTAQFFQKAFPGQDVVLGNLDKDPRNQPQERPEAADYSKLRRSKPVHLADQEAETDNETESGKDYSELRRRVEQTVALSGKTSKFLVYKGEQEGESLADDFSRLLQADDSPFSAVNSNNVINIDAQLELDGIGGFSAFQVLNITNIPRVFENNGVFTIDSVTHNVSTDDWTTELKTSFVVRNTLGEGGGEFSQQFIIEDQEPFIPEGSTAGDFEG